MTRYYSMTKIGAGDWLVPSNDRATVYRITSYEDGRAYGLDRGPEVVTRWHVRRADAGAHAVGDPRDWDWSDVEQGYWSRKEALDAIFGGDS